MGFANKLWQDLTLKNTWSLQIYVSPPPQCSLARRERLDRVEEAVVYAHSVGVVLLLHYYNRRTVGRRKQPNDALLLQFDDLFLEMGLQMNRHRIYFCPYSVRGDERDIMLDREHASL